MLKLKVIIESISIAAWGTVPVFVSKRLINSNDWPVDTEVNIEEGSGYVRICLFPLVMVPVIVLHSFMKPFPTIEQMSINGDSTHCKNKLWKKVKNEL